MKRATKQQIYNACELLATGEQRFTCIALLENLDTADCFVSMYELEQIEDYANFYNKRTCTVWFRHNDADARIICLLLYLEARDSL